MHRLRPLPLLQPLMLRLWLLLRILTTGQISIISNTLLRIRLRTLLRVFSLTTSLRLNMVRLPRVSLISMDRPRHLRVNIHSTDSPRLLKASMDNLSTIRFRLLRVSMVRLRYLRTGLSLLMVSRFPMGCKISIREVIPMLIP